MKGERRVTASRFVLFACVAGCALAGCRSADAGSAEKAAQLEAQGQRKDTRAPEQTPPRHFGAPFSVPGEPTQIAEIMRAPEAFLGTKVKCSGEVARVCQAMGCWLELRAGANAPGLRVPMADHAFFVPQDIVGRTAVIEGVLSRSALSEAQLAHLKGEGLEATGPLFLAATSVRVR